MQCNWYIQYIRKRKKSTYIPVYADRYAKVSKTVIFHLETLGNPWQHIWQLFPTGLSQ